MTINLCCTLNASVECETCKKSWCRECWDRSTHVDINRSGAWGICPADGKTPGWAHMKFWNSRHILLATTDENRLMRKREGVNL